MKNCFSQYSDEGIVAQACAGHVRIVPRKIANATGWEISRVEDALDNLSSEGIVVKNGESYTATAELDSFVTRDETSAETSDDDGSAETHDETPAETSDDDGSAETHDETPAETSDDGSDATPDATTAATPDNGSVGACFARLVNALPKRVEDPLASFMAAVEALPHLEVIEGDALELAKGETVDKISAVADAWNKLFEELATRKTVRTIDPRNEVVSVSTVEAGVKGTYSFRGRERIAFFPKWPKPATGEGLERMVAEAKAGCEHHAAYVLAYATGKIEVHGKPKGKPNGKPKGKPKAKPAAVSSPNADTLTPSVADIIKSALGQ